MHMVNLESRQLEPFRAKGLSLDLDPSSRGLAIVNGLRVGHTWTMPLAEKLVPLSKCRCGQNKLRKLAEL
jgi:hypothetical protein